MSMIPYNRIQGRKYDTIDLLTLYGKRDASQWNLFLTQALLTQDVEGLKKTLYGIQAGMTDLAKMGLADEKLMTFFFRLQKSLEDTAKRIFRKKYPNPLDNPTISKQPNDALFKNMIAAKRKRDAAFEAFLRGASF